MKKIFLFASLLALNLTQSSYQIHQNNAETAKISAFAAPAPIELIYNTWIINKIDPTQMPTWKDLSEGAKQANLNINKKMIKRGSFYKFNKAGEANILVYNPFHKAEFHSVPTFYTYNEKNQYITLEKGMKVDENGDAFIVPAMEYRIEKLTKKELVLVVVANNYKLFFKAK